jgi:hypothetical protein
MSCTFKLFSVAPCPSPNKDGMMILPLDLWLFGDFSLSLLALTKALHLHLSFLFLKI